MILTIDSGTTNTRIYLVDNKSVKYCLKINVGAGSTAKYGNNNELKAGISDGIKRILDINNIALDRISAIYASGMLTSELGIYTLPHIEAPCGAYELKQGMKTVKIAEICAVPITFIPGVKNKTDYSDANNLADADIMRGEETELMGLINLTGIKPPFVAVLPGSHTKIIKVDECGKIRFCKSTLGGELLSCIPLNTILKNSVNYPILNNNPNYKYIDKGYMYCEKYGISTALFKARVLANFYGETHDNCGSYLAGVILQPDIICIKDVVENERVLIGGSEPLKSVFKHLIETHISNDTIVASEEQVKNSTVFGVIHMSGIIIKDHGEVSDYKLQVDR